MPPEPRAGEPDRRLLVAMVSFGPRPPVDDPQSLTLVGVARALAAHPELRVVLTPWPRLYFDDGRVALRGTVYELESPSLVRPLRLDAPTPPDAVLFYPQGGTGKPGSNSDETDALVRFAPLDLGDAARDRHHLVRRLVAEAGKRGLVCNAAGRDESWGLKDYLEQSLRAYEAHTACRVPRPDTWIAAGGDVATIVGELGRRGVNLCKLESRPIPSQPWQYRFYLDLEGHAASQQVSTALEAVRPLCAELRVLGTYPRAS